MARLSHLIGGVAYDGAVLGRTPVQHRDEAPGAVSSGGEHFLDAEGVRGSNPLPPTDEEAGQQA
jgi:hypothetical protein